MSRMKILVATMMIVAAPSVVCAKLTGIEVLPPSPLETDSVVLNAELLWPSSGYMVLGSSVTFLSDFEPQIDIDVLVPDGGVLHVLTSEVHSIDLGPLPAGTYSYTVNEIQTPPSGLPLEPYWDQLTLEGTFTVVPEPTTMTVLALGGLAVLRRRKL